MRNEIKLTYDEREGVPVCWLTFRATRKEELQQPVVELLCVSLTQEHADYAIQALSWDSETKPHVAYWQEKSLAEHIFASSLSNIMTDLLDRPHMAERKLSTIQRRNDNAVQSAKERCAVRVSAGWHPHVQGMKLEKESTE